MMKRVIVITGGSDGLGKSIAERLAQNEENEVIILSNQQDKLTDAAIETNSDYQVCDVTNHLSVETAVNNILQKYKKIDVLINNAGISQIKEFTQITDEDWNNMINTNLNSVFYMSQEACKNMIHNKKGCIINISSIWGITGASCEVHYSVSKAGVDALTKALAKELGPSNIRVNSIAPGIINTEMNSHLNKDEIEGLKEEIPLERIGKTQDIERCVEWLIEDEYTTGQVISINGGWNI